ncbi:hypothetical protein [Loktanella fryxellensis]|uniref:hypothetical protein n=1 Tax=Loktanella fryxellensis TaxID=245187 RepID=UPI0015A6C963|nr:hypothetical protein [Loktanella fryxellensis]
MQRLVDAHYDGRTPVSTAYLKKGMEDQSMANIFNQPLWGKLTAEFLRRPKKGSYEIAI